MHSVVFRPLSHFEEQRLFVQTFLSTSHYPEKWEGETFFSLFSIFDNLIGLIRLPYLYVEVKKVNSIIKEEVSPFKFRGETLALVASGAEIFIWCAERKFIVLGGRGTHVLQGICYLSRMILYEEAVLKEGKALFSMWKGKQTQKKELNQLKVQFISHTTYLGWVTLNFIALCNGKGYPRQFTRYLRVVSFTFGLLASGYNEMDSNLRNGFKRFLPKRSIYCF